MNVYLMYVGISVAVGLAIYGVVGGLFEWLYYRRRRAAPETWKIQARRFPSPRFRREEIALGAFNLTMASAASGLFAGYVASGGKTGIYTDFSQHGLLFSITSAVVYFVVTDGALYWAHRILHRPKLFRWIHRWHHRYTSPTAFTSMAVHPLEMSFYHSIMLVPLFVYPIHVVGLVVVLVYQNLIALVDHSGVRGRMWLPWQPPARFHDDHHVYFHVNYGQTLGAWDRLFGTWRREGRRYGPEVFGGKGAAVDGTPAVAPLVDYSHDRGPDPMPEPGASA